MGKFARSWALMKASARDQILGRPTTHLKLVRSSKSKFLPSSARCVRMAAVLKQATATSP